MLGIELSDAEARAEFGKMDESGDDGGKVLFEEFCQVRIVVGVSSAQHGTGSSFIMAALQPPMKSSAREPWLWCGWGRASV